MDVSLDVYAPFLARSRDRWEEHYWSLGMRTEAKDWQAAVKDLTPVQKKVHLAARWTSFDKIEFADRLFNEGRETYRQSLQAELNRWGCAGHQALAPSKGAELSAIRERADWAAESVMHTYNLELTHAIIAVGEDVPKANRNTYASRLFYREGSWDGLYWEAKSQFISEVESMTMINAAVADFYARNGDMLAPEVDVLPLAAVCPTCQELVAGNPWKSVEAIFNKYDMPPHPRCVLPGQDILMSDGNTKDICLVETGECVFTPDGSQEVIEVFERSVDELIYRLEVEDRVLELTGDHPVLTRNGWLAVQDLKEGQEILVSSWCDGLSRGSADTEQ